MHIVNLQHQLAIHRKCLLISMSNTQKTIISDINSSCNGKYLSSERQYL